MSNAREIKEIRLSPGTHQTGRLPHALWPDDIKIDERSLADLLNYMVEYADNIYYFNEKDIAQTGWWKEFLLKDISVFLATIIRTDARVFSKELDDLIHDFEHARGEQWLEIYMLIRLIERIYILIDEWYARCLKINLIPGEWMPPLVDEFHKMINVQLKDARRKLIAYDEFVKEQHTPDKSREPKDKQGLSSRGINADESDTEGLYKSREKIWEYEEEKELGSRGGIAPEGTVKTEARISEDPQIVFKQLQLIYRDFYNALIYIITLAKRLFPSTLVKKQDHSPDVALIISFLELFKHSQNHLNGLTQRHLDHFYKDILKQSSKGGIADKVSVYVTLANHIQSYKLEEGTLLSAGRNDEGIEIHYQSDEAVWLQQTNIVGLKTIRLTKNNIANLESPLMLVSNIYTAPVANSPNGVKKLENGEKHIWALFGETQEDKTIAEKTMIDAEIGFAISDPVLFLNEGKRKISVNLRFDLDSYSRRLTDDNISAAKLLDLIESILEYEKEQNGEDYFIDREKVFNKVFQNSLILTISTPKGWLEIENYQILPPKNAVNNLDWEIPEITLSFELEIAHPPITAPDPETILEVWDTEFPVLKILLNPTAPAYVYSFVKYLKLETITINTEVEGLKDLDFFTDIGKLDSSTPFQIFGPTPSLGSYLLIGSPEIFRKKLTELKIDIDWYNLPESFGKHYVSYDGKIDNLSFEIEISALSDYRFYPIANKQRLPLFQEFIPPTSQNNGKKTQTDPVLQQATHWETIDIERLEINAVSTLDRALAFDNQTVSGFLKLELQSPEMAFGHQVYPNVFLEIVTENAQAKQKGLLPQRKKKQQPLPEQPYTPVAKAVSISYQAQKKIHILPSTNADIENDTSFYHLFPFGKKQIFGRGRAGERALLPQYNREGYLYMGFDKLHTEYPISLLFRLVNSKLEDNISISWSYLINDIWVSLPAASILFDGTERFTRTGIIKLNLPRDISNEHQIMPSGVYWLRLAVDGLEVDAIDIHPNALNATWAEDENLHNRDRSLAPHTIENLAVKVPEIKQIIQPYFSYGGKNPETIPAFYARVSERLRHKNRGVNAWDIERLILERFHALHQVKCLSYEEIDRFQQSIGRDSHPLFPGEMIVVVVPKIHSTNSLKPIVNVNYLRNIEKFISKYISPFVYVKAQNPVYEQVKVSCEVLFNEGLGQGEAYDLLNQDIKRFICPWLSDPKIPMKIGGRINKDALLNFIQRRDYVEFISKFSIVQVIKTSEDSSSSDNTNGKEIYRLQDTTRSLDDSPVIQASTPWSVLIPLERHQIVFTSRKKYADADLLGGESLMIGVDYVIGDIEEKLGEIDSTSIPQLKTTIQENPEIHHILEIEDIDL